MLRSKKPHRFLLGRSTPQSYNTTTYKISARAHTFSPALNFRITLYIAAQYQIHSNYES